MNPYRRLGVIARLAHAAYGFITAHAIVHIPPLGWLMLALFLLYESSETIADIVNRRLLSKADFPDDELAELAAGIAAYVILSLLAG